MSALIGVSVIFEHVAFEMRETNALLSPANVNGHETETLAAQTIVMTKGHALLEIGGTLAPLAMDEIHSLASRVTGIGEMIGEDAIVGRTFSFLVVVGRLTSANFDFDRRQLTWTKLNYHPNLLRRGKLLILPKVTCRNKRRRKFGSKKIQ